MEDLHSDIDDGTNDVLTGLRNYVLTRQRASAARCHDGDNNACLIIDKPSDIPIVDKAEWYMVTLNIRPCHLMNKKRWCTYTHDQQRGQLERIEKAMRRKYESIELRELHYEICPSLNNMHFHALYRMTSDHVAEMAAYYDKYSGNNDKTIKKWRHLDIQKCKDVDKWLAYIRKDQKLAKLF